MHNDCTDQLEAISNATDELRALNEMLLTTIENGDLKRHTYSISSLYDRIFDNIDGSTEQLTTAIDRIKKGSLGITDPAVIAQITGVNLTSVKLVMWAVAGSPMHAETDSMLADDDALYVVFRRKLRDADLVERARGTVSEWSGVAPEIVEKVLHAAGEAATEFMFRRHRNERAKQQEEDRSGSAAGPAGDHGRAGLLAERVNAGVDPAKIAKAVNLKPETVERVIAQLLAEPVEDAEPDKATGIEG